ncbi:hypothetical protein F4679DRAFT_581321 [Xylaria curta]|nr:hypothetical protein F4679DRAFT_581321 [Xylaria curta]
MKPIITIAALFAFMVTASLTGNHDERDITPEGLWKRWCDGSPVEDPIYHTVLSGVVLPTTLVNVSRAVQHAEKPH